MNSPHLEPALRFSASLEITFSLPPVAAHGKSGHFGRLLDLKNPKMV